MATNMRRRKDTRERFDPHIPKEQWALYVPCHKKEQGIREAAEANKTPGKFMIDAMDFYLEHFRRERELREEAEEQDINKPRI